MALRERYGPLFGNYIAHEWEHGGKEVWRQVKGEQVVRMVPAARKDTPTETQTVATMEGDSAQGDAPEADDGAGSEANGTAEAEGEAMEE